MTAHDAIRLVDKGETEVPYSSALAHLSAHLERARWLMLRYMRNFADRLLQADGRYSDLVVSPQELRRLAGQTPSTDGQDYLDTHQIPSLDEIEAHLDTLGSGIESRLALSSDEASVLPIEELRAGFMLSNLELDMLLLAAAPRLSPDLMRLAAFSWADFSIRQPTGAFLIEAATRTQAEASRALSLLGDGANLIRFRLLIPRTHALWKPATPRLHAAMEVPQRILDFLRGDILDRAGLAGCQLHEGGLPVDELVIPEAHRDRMMMQMRRTRPRYCFSGPTRSGRRTVARSLASLVGVRLLEVDLRRAISDQVTSDILQQLGEILREARLHHACLLLRLDELGETTIERALTAQSPGVQSLLASFPGALFLAAPSAGALVKAIAGDIESAVLVPPDVKGQAILWTRALKDRLPEEKVVRMSAELGRNYRLPAGAITHAVQRTVELSPPGRRGRANQTLSIQKLLKTIQSQMDHRLGWLADSVSVELGLGDVVLSDEQREALDEVLMFARHSDTVFNQWGFGAKGPAGQGLSVMFSGPPGTGKTLVACVMARELGRAVYRVDLSRIVDKYIGETEKNLGRVFDEAERAQAVLLFDEADSLFAKRTSVKSSNDRYANLEVNFLLQRLETFDGMSILTTNFGSAIDDAFQRRIRFKLDFEMPSADLRAELWEKLLPPNAPVAENIDFESLGHCFEFSGGHVRNAILRASIRAAGSKTPLDFDHLYKSGVAESREMGVLVLQEPKKRNYDDVPIVKAPI